MWKYIILTGLIFSVLIRCSSTAKHKSVAPPFLSDNLHNLENKSPQLVEDYLQKMESDYKDKKTHYWWIQYKRAQNWELESKDKSCAIYSQLSQTQDFPLYKLSQLKAAFFCKSPLNEYTWSKDFIKETSWLQNLQNQYGYELALANKDVKEFIHYSIELSKSSVIQNEKINYTLEARKWAQNNNLKEEFELSQERLEKIAPRYISEPKTDQYFKVAYDYRRVRDFKKARELYNSILNNKSSTESDKLTAWKAIATTYKLERDRKKHLKVYGQLANYIEKKFKKNKKSTFYLTHYHNIMISYSRALWTQSHVSQAHQILQNLTKNLKGRYSLMETQWLLARMAEEKANYKEAISHAELALKEKTFKSYLKYASLWTLAWNHRKLGNYNDSIAALEKLIEEDDNEFSQFKYLFWLANNYGKIGDTAKAYSSYEQLGEKDPLGYYGLLSYYQRGLKYPSLKKVSDQINIDSKDQLPLHKSKIATLDWLISVGEKDLAKDFLNNLNLSPKKDEEFVELFKMYSKAGDYNGLFRNIAMLSNEQKNTLILSNPEFLFPRPFYSIIDNSSDKFSVSPELVYAIIRQESAFSPHARSFADAFGLMQLIPKQARRLSGVHQLNYTEPDDLFKPNINVPLGTALLNEISKKYNGQFILTTASYNASERAVMNWVKTRYNGDPITFIEDIPYEETKTYIKLVLRNYIFYKRMNQSDMEMEFPESTLRGLASFK